MALNFWVHFESDVPYVCQVRVREKECMWETDAHKMKKVHVCVCVIFFCFDLSCYYPLSPAVKCAAVMTPSETRRQTEEGFLLSESCDESSGLHCHCAQHSLCKQETAKAGGKEGGKTQ